MTNPNYGQHPSDWIDPVGEDVALAWGQMYEDGPGYVPTIAEENLAWINTDAIFKDKVKKALEALMKGAGVDEIVKLVYEHRVATVFALHKVFGIDADFSLTDALNSEINTKFVDEVKKEK